MKQDALPARTRRRARAASATTRPDRGTQAHEVADLDLSSEAILDALADAVGLYDADGRLVHANAAMRTLLGIQVDPGYGELPTDVRAQRVRVRYPDGRPVPPGENGIALLLRGEKQLNARPWEALITTLDGREVCISMTGTSLLDTKGQVKGAIATLRDITEQRRLDQQLRFQASMLDRAHDAIFLWELGGPIVYWNRGAELLYGYSAADAIGRNSHELLHTVLPLPAKEFDAYLAEAGEWTGEIVHTTSDGHTLYMLSRFQVQSGMIRAGDMRTYVVQTGQDITSRKRAEERLRTLQSVTARLAAAHSLDEVRTVVRRELAAALDAQAVAWRVVAGDALARDDLAPTSVVSDDSRHARARIPLAEAHPAAEAARTGEPVFMRDAAEHRARFPGSHAADTGRPAAGGAHIPLRRGEEIFAVLSIETAARHDWDDDERAFVAALADRAAVAYERARLFEAEREARRSLETVLDVLPAAVIIADAQGALVQVNKAFHDIWGEHSPAQGIDQYQIYHAWRADGQPIGQHDWALSRAITQGETVADEEIHILSFDGKRKTILNNAVPLRDQDGHIVGGIAAFVDITERKQAEGRNQKALQALIAMAQALVDRPAIADEAPDESRTAWQSTRTLATRLAELTRDVLNCQRIGLSSINMETGEQRALAVVGLTPEQEPEWWAEQENAPKYGEGAEPELLARFEAGEAQVIDMTAPPYDQIPNKYGITTTLVVPLRLGGVVIGALSMDHGGVRHEYTADELELAEAVGQLQALVIERERLLEERAAAEADVLAQRQAGERMDRFLSMASHELRTPLTVLSANLDLLARREERVRVAAETADAAALDAALRTAQTLVERGQTGVTRMTRLVDDLLDVSRIRTGKFVLRKEHGDLTAIVRTAVEEQRQVHGNRTITLELASTAALPVNADPLRIGQVITNYLTNALKYSEAHQPVTVRVAREGQTARVSVQDHGQGLSPEDQQLIWDAFYRAEGIDVVSGSGIGLGLGLHICKIIADLHGGEVGVESIAGEGSTFWLSLPLSTD